MVMTRISPILSHLGRSLLPRSLRIHEFSGLLSKSSCRWYRSQWLTYTTPTSLPTGYRHTKLHWKMMMGSNASNAGYSKRVYYENHCSLSSKSPCHSYWTVTSTTDYEDDRVGHWAIPYNEAQAVVDEDLRDKWTIESLLRCSVQAED